MRRGLPFITALAVALAPSPLRASVFQCPDGSPPPCARAAAALDDKRWIVVPFQNVTRTPDAEWLGSASVNLLYLNLSRWSDLKVVDDERVADLLRSRGRPGSVGLADALALARHAGAGQMVMGDIVKTGGLLTVVGKVYRVASGQRVRQVTVQVPSSDSVFPAYRSLAARLLDLPEAGAATGIGTASLDAYREYVKGLAAMRSWQLDTARSALARAIAADTAFALAHYQLARTLGWVGTDEQRETAEVASALRVSGGLPDRERALIAAYADFLAGRFEPAATTYQALLARDSTDAEAWYSLGEIEFHDNVVAVDGTRGAFGGSWNKALTAFQRTLAFDPAYHLAYAHIADIHKATTRYGCRRPRPGSHLCEARDFIAWIRLDGDSLLMVPRAADLTADTALADMDAAGRSGLEPHNRAALRDAAARWVQAGPQEADAHVAYAEALVRTGDPEGAAREMAALSGTSRLRRPDELGRLRIEIAIKRERYADAYALADSLFARPLLRGGDPANGVYVLLGQFHRWDQRVYPGWPEAVKNAYAATARTTAGVPPTNLAEAEEGFVRYASSDTAFHADRAVDRLGALLLTTAFAMDRPREHMPADTTVDNVFMQLVSARVLRNRDAIRRFGLALEQSPDNGLAAPITRFVLLAESFLEIGDSSRARALLARLETDVFPSSALDGGEYSAFSGEPGLWGRAFLLQGDLATAAGDTATMVRAYRRVVGLWSQADPVLQPAVDRARSRLGTARHPE